MGTLVVALAIQPCVRCHEVTWPHSMEPCVDAAHFPPPPSCSTLNPSARPPPLLRGLSLNPGPSPTKACGTEPRPGDTCGAALPPPPPPACPLLELDSWPSLGSTAGRPSTPSGRPRLGDRDDDTRRGVWLRAVTAVCIHPPGGNSDSSRALFHTIVGVSSVEHRYCAMPSLFSW